MFSDEYVITLQHIYELTKSGQTEKIETDFSIPKMFGAWSSIFWAMPYLDKFRELTLEELKHLIQALIKSYLNYKATTNQYLRTETINWLAGTLKIKASLSGPDGNEGLYAEKWVNQLFENPETEYNYTTEIGETLSMQNEIKEELANKIKQEKIERLRDEELKNERKQAEKQKTLFEHLEKNKQQREKRERFLETFSTLSLFDKLKLITKEHNPLHYYPKDIANVPSDIINALTENERAHLLNMIKKSKIKEWDNTKERIQQLGMK